MSEVRVLRFPLCHDRMREIPLSAIEEAARTIYNPVVRTPLVRLDWPRTPFAARSRRKSFSSSRRCSRSDRSRSAARRTCIRQLPARTMRDGVWTVSAGNAAQGVALAARIAGVPCSVMVMDTAPATKVRAIEQLGATIVRATYDECWRTVEAHGSDRMRGLFVHPFDDDRFIAGNGTAGLEILDDLPDVDAVVAPLGGGGLLAGVAAAIRARRPGVKVFAAEPETASPFDTSLENGRASAFEGWQRLVRRRRRRTIGAAHDVAAAVAAAGRFDRRDARARSRPAMKLVAERCHVIAEGAAGCAVAAALTGRVRGKIVAIVSGGNIDLPTFASLVAAQAVGSQ